ncbi:UNVERIFIED_CONTAM: hypothetical protein GTU68_002002, partial [Idotea baltica]|nr:hypothetical protein [Idotea baltica]
QDRGDRFLRDRQDQHLNSLHAQLVLGDPEGHRRGRVPVQDNQSAWPEHQDHPLGHSGPGEV